MHEAGRVAIGFSKPYVAKYANSGTTVTYSDGQLLARGISVTITPEMSDDVVLWGDNRQIEIVPGRVTGGTCSITVDGLLDETEKLVYGLPAAETISYDSGKTENVYVYGDSMKQPYVGLGFVAKFVSGGEYSYVPFVLNKCVFGLPNTNLQTAEESTNFQTSEIEVNFYMDDSDAHAWKKVGAGVATEADAEAILKTMLNIA